MPTWASKKEASEKTTTPILTKTPLSCGKINYLKLHFKRGVHVSKKQIMRLAGIGLIGVAALASLPGYWPVIAGLGGVALFLLAGPG